MQAPQVYLGHILGAWPWHTEAVRITPPHKQYLLADSSATSTAHYQSSCCRVAVLLAARKSCSGLEAHTKCRLAALHCPEVRRCKLMAQCETLNSSARQMLKGPKHHTLMKRKVTQTWCPLSKPIAAPPLAVFTFVPSSCAQQEIVQFVAASISDHELEAGSHLVQEEQAV